MVKEISGTTGLCCLFGHPVSHSISPAMHNTAFRALGLDHVYLAFDVTEAEISTAVAAVRTLGIRGVNLTMPLKKAVLPYLDRLSEAAKLSGSVNTIVNENGVLTGHTTDGIGFRDSLGAYGMDLPGKILTVLGAGGAAESIVTQAALDGAKEIRIFKRKNATFSETEAFAERTAAASGCRISVLPFSEEDLLSEALLSSDLLINATPVGMGEDKETPVKKSYLHPALFGSDLIYHPAETTLLREAKEAGCRTANGKYMLLYQGAASFFLWTGQPMPVDVVKKACFSEA